MIKTKEVGHSLCVLGLAVILGGCASEYKKEAAQEQQAKTMPVYCATADGDLRMLQSEKVSVSKEAAAGVTAVAPIGLVAGLFTHTEGEKFQVATGDYNKALDTKIAEIKTTCNIA
ncbi:conserved exported hypothetical protein [Burkholderiales bacterium]|nr:conserved exported hypothetical protein [Burkholderiales bacterium]